MASAADEAGFPFLAAADPVGGLGAADRERAQRDLVGTGRTAVCDRHELTAADLAASYLQRAG